MASKNATVTSKSTSTVGANGGRLPPQFVKYRLNDDELSQAKSACENATDIGEIVSQFVAEGYKFSAGKDNYGGGIQVFLTPSVPTSVNTGWTLTARAPDLTAAVGMLAWKHYTLFGMDWPKENADSGGPNWG